MIRALHIASAVLVNLPMRRALESVARKVSEGSSLNGALEQSGFFSPLTVQLISSGEASGNLEAMLERAAQNQERETAAQLAIFFGLFEPLLILVMGAIVLVIVIAILMPIFELNQLLN
jgi:general secretion pathway protein F